MRFLLDTNHWSYLQRKHPTVLARIAGLASNDELHISVISQGELLSGVEFLPDGQRKDQLRRLYEDVLQFAGFAIPIEPAIAEQYALVISQLRRIGKPIVTNDVWLGATAIVHDLTLVTNDSHFRNIHGLRLEDWTAPSGS